jgi:hypothetical protein
MTLCNCFASALQVSDQLHRTETAIASTSFDYVLSVARNASYVCRQYASCPHCSDPSYFTIYVILLRKAAACYNYLIQSGSNGSSPSTTSSSSQGSSSHGWYGGTSRLRIGSFEVEAALDEHTRNLILRTEVRRAVEAAAQLETVLGSSSVKGQSPSRDATTLQYQRALVSTLRDEVGNLERVLLTM